MPLFQNMSGWMISVSASSVPEGNKSIAIGASKAIIKWIRITTTSTNWTLTIYRRDNYSTGAWVVVTGRSGDHDLYLDSPYEDLDASGEFHYSFTSASGSETHNITIEGVTLQ